MTFHWLERFTGIVKSSNESNNKSNVAINTPSNERIKLDSVKKPAEEPAVAIGKPMTKGQVMADKMKANFASYDSKYGKLFTELQLDSDHIDALKEIFIERDLLTGALMTKKRENSREVLVPYRGGQAGITVYNEDRTNWAAEFYAVKENDELEINNLLGDQGYALYTYYENTVGFRAEVDNIQSRLKEQNIPALGDSQMEKIVSISYSYASNSKYLGRATNITDQALNDIRQYLSSEQYQVVVDYQREKAAYQALVDKTVASVPKR